jgi:acetyl esterase/lipase
VSDWFLVFAVAVFLLTANAIRPCPLRVLSVPSFFGGWLASELAPHNLVITVVGTIVFVAAGAVVGVKGVVALVLCLLAAAGLVYLIIEAHGSRDVMEDALCEGLGPQYLDRISSQFSDNYDLRVPWRQLVTPLARRHPEVERIRNIQYRGAGRRGRLDVYRRKDHPSGCPVLLQIHGGGWVIGNKDQQGLPLMNHLASRGWVCVSTNYRLSPRATFPEHLLDLKETIRWIREHGPEYGADPDFLIVTGGSAGGHLTALVGLTANDPEYQPGFEDVDTSVDAAIPYYGVYDFTDESGLKMARDRLKFLEKVVVKLPYADHREEFRKASPIFRVREDAPPFFVIHGHHDSLVPVEEARLFVEGMREKSESPVVYAELPGAQHAFEIFPSIRTAHVVRAAERFCDYIYSAYLGRRDAAPAAAHDTRSPA